MDSCCSRGGSSEVVSCHLTSEGVLVYTRCACGALRLQLHRPEGRNQVIVEGRHRPFEGASGRSMPSRDR